MTFFTVSVNTLILGFSGGYSMQSSLNAEMINKSCINCQRFSKCMNQVGSNYWYSYFKACSELMICYDCVLLHTIFWVSHVLKSLPDYTIHIYQTNNFTSLSKKENPCLKWAHEFIIHGNLSKFILILWFPFQKPSSFQWH